LHENGGFVKVLKIYQTMTAKLLPYLNFNSQTKEAMEFYQSVLGGELTMQTFGETGMPVEDKFKDNIMHAELKNDDLTFMASDGDAHHTITMGDNISMSLIGTEDTRLSGFFEKLAEGGKIDQPLVEAPWGDKFGMLTDKFGVHWMVNISKGERK
jgi:PhnB protein